MFSLFLKTKSLNLTCGLNRPQECQTLIDAKYNHAAGINIFLIELV